jgi:hypothetical protein
MVGHGLSSFSPFQLVIAGHTQLWTKHVRWLRLRSQFSQLLLARLGKTIDHLVA